VTRVLQVAHPRCEEVHSEALRLEAHSFVYHFDSLETATEAAFFKLRQQSDMRVLYIRVERDVRGRDFALKCLVQIVDLRPFQPPVQSYRREYRHNASVKDHILTKETRDARFYTDNQTTLKEFRWFDCDTVNKALAEAVSLQCIEGNRCKLVDIDLIRRNRIKEPRIGLYLTGFQVSVADDVAQRRKTMHYYSEDQLLKSLHQAASILLGAHNRVNPTQAILHTCLHPANLGIEETITSVQGFGLTWAIPCDPVSRLYMCPEWRGSGQGDAQLADVFALGAVMLHMARLWVPCGFHTSDVTQLADVIENSLSGLKYSQGFKDILAGMLAVRPEHRVTMKLVVQRAQQISTLPAAQSPQPEPIPLVIRPLTVLREPEPHCEELDPSALLAALVGMRGSASIPQLTSIYVQLFELYCKNGTKSEAERVANEALSMHQVAYPMGNSMRFSCYQSFISTASDHGFYRLAKQLTTSALFDLQYSTTASPLEYNYCYRQLAVLNARLGSLQEAEKFAVMSLKGREPNTADAEILLLAAESAYLDDRKRKCVQYANQALKLGGEQLPVLTLLASTTLELEDYASSKAHYQRLIPLKQAFDPAADLYALHQALAVSCFRLQAYSEAETEYMWLLASPRAPDCCSLEAVEYYANLGVACHQLGKLETAEHYYTLAVDIKQKLNQPLDLITSSLQGLVAVEKDLGRCGKVPNLLRNFIRKVEEIEGEQSQITKAALVFAQSSAESVPLPLLASEFYHLLQQYEEKSVDFLAVASNLIAQGELLKAEETLYSHLVQIYHNHTRFPQSSGYSIQRFLRLVADLTSQQLALPFKYQLGMANSSAELLLSNNTWQARYTPEADKDLHCWVDDLKQANPTIQAHTVISTITNRLDTSGDALKLADLKTAYSFLAEGFLLQSQALSNMSDLQGALRDAHEASLIRAVLACICSLQPSRLLVKLMLTAGSWGHLVLPDLATVDVGEGLWTVLVQPVVRKTREVSSVYVSQCQVGSS